MIERRVTLPADTDDVWKALVDSEILRHWFDGDVEWDLIPGGELTVTEPDGSSRNGVIKTVDEGNELQFEWWPEDDHTNVSEVTYTLESTEDDETVLTVVERPLEAQMSAAEHTWSTTDDVLFRLWARIAPSLIRA
jgi:uncharacterized protein YndB with AHSA1/START domain